MIKLKVPQAILATALFFLSITPVWGAYWGLGVGDLFGLSPYWDWRTIETEHFRVTFPAELTDVAMKAANDLEEANALLSRQLYWQPETKAQVLVIDNEDSANGVTSAVLRFGMILYVTPPDNWFSTAYYDDWLRLLTIHEYTHFVNMDTTTDWAQALRYVFGDTLLPNALWPSWMLEGLAVYMETRFTHSGRGRSAYYEMVLRSAVESGVLNTDRFVTINRLGGPNPYYPGGETVYLFGYEMMNEVARRTPEGSTADGEGGLRDGEDALGVMSKRSSHRLPFFINGNLENITGKDWYNYWALWIQDTETRIAADLKKIKSQPVTTYQNLTEKSSEVLGSAASPDGHWIAYSRQSPDERMGLYLLDLKTGMEKRLFDKTLGATVAFAPDSKAVFFSSLERRKEYYFFSDLGVYDIERNSRKWLTSGRRARDPDVSRDGKWITFTITEKATTGLALAPLERGPSGYRLGRIEKLYMPPEYDRVSTPKFSADGRKILFTIHHNGTVSEDLAEYDVDARSVNTLVSDGTLNRFPAVSPAGEIFFVSDATGVDNLYRYVPGKKPDLATNLLTGIAYPMFGPGGLYGSIFSYHGSELARVEPLAQPISPEVITIAKPPSPAGEIHPAGKTPEEKSYPVEDYSIFPSIWPRQWAPFAYLGPGAEVFLGGEVLGYDAVDRHRYLMTAGYDTKAEKADVSLLYSNRSLGPTLTASGSLYTSNLYSAAPANTLYIAREVDLSATISYPILWTYSSLTPSMSIDTQQQSTYARSTIVSGGDDVLVGKSLYVPSVDTVLAYSSAESSDLAVTYEEGRQTLLGSRVYLDYGTNTWKGLLTDAEYIQVARHLVLIPSLKASMVNQIDTNYSSANVQVQGHLPYLFGGFSTNYFNQLPIRGYPAMTFYTRAATIGALDFDFPLLPIFQGWGTNPLFLQNLYGFTFGEATYFPYGDQAYNVLPSAGGGVKLTTLIFVQTPLTLSVQYNYGFQTQAGGGNEAFLEIGLGPLPF